MGITAQVTEVQHATERLHSILAGLSFDYKLKDKELSALYEWFSMPFRFI